MKALTTVLLAAWSVHCTFAYGAEYKGPAGWLSPTANGTLWKKYCTGEADSPEIPGVNYKNAEVKRAAKVLSEQVAPLSYYLYPAILDAYGLRGSNKKLKPAPAGAPAGTTPEAHAFLVYTCGEFRDRAGMVKAKIGWVNNIQKLPITKQAKINPQKEIWSQVSAHSYLPYLEFSDTLWDARQQAVTQTVKVGSHELPGKVEGTTVCETKYIFAEYIDEGKEFDTLDAYVDGLRDFAEDYCSDDDINSYYDFRGDSNFKPYSPESNGMIWYALSVAGQCKSTTASERCREYFTSPFWHRWNAARAGLATWMVHDKKFDEQFGSEGQSIVILPHDEFDSRPFEFRIDGKKYSSWMPEWEAISGAFNMRDLGLNQLIKWTSAKPDLDFAYTRLRDMVNRHADWYSSGWDDGVGKERPQAYSPLVASSYEMRKSDGFAQPGATVSSPSDGRKHWMFVFKVKRKNWYNSARLKAKEPIDFDTMWFDETTLGDNHLTMHERAWDRLGTALEGELDSILYLHNITTDHEVEDDADVMGN